MMLAMRKVLAPFLVASAVLLATVAGLAALAARKTGGELVYTLDDPYIHMAIAKNLVRHGVFGVTRYGFSSSTSSPLWTLLMAASYAVVGVRHWVPGAWCVVFAIAALGVASAIGRLFGLGPWRNTALCLAALGFTPLPVLVSTGMEHTLHVAAVLALLLYVLRYLETPATGHLARACMAAALATGVRYETFFVLFPLAVVVASHRRLRAAAGIVAAGCVVPVLYAVFSVAHGSYPLPNSLLLKGTFHDLSSVAGVLNALGLHALLQVQDTAHMLALCVLVLGVSLVAAREQTAIRWVPAAFVAACLLHGQFAVFGWFYRYEGYLVAMGVALAGGLLLAGARVGGQRPEQHARKDWHPVMAGLGSVVLLCLPLAVRAVRALAETPRASRNIYEQQWQMGRFLRDAFPAGTRVAVNDLGAVAYLADVRVLDLFGLGSIEVVRAKREGHYDTVTIARLLREHDTEYLILYKHWFRGPRALPDHVVEVATWDITDNVVCGGGKVTFFATSPQRARALAEAIESFRPKLPRSVRVTMLLGTPPPQGGP